MRLDLATPIEVEITLSRRNLRALLAFLDSRRSGEEPLLAFLDPTKDVLLVVNGEEDQPHYAKRCNPPGRMPEHVEARLEQGGREAEVRSSGGDEPCA
jgi:hypothetical protein